MKKYYILLWATLIVFSCNNKEKKFDEHTYQEQKISLAQREKENPKTFFKLQGDDHRNIFGKTVYKGTIKNTASVVAYKDVRVKLLYYKNGNLVANHEELFDNTISPNNKFDFKTKYKTPHGTDSVAAYIMSAKAVQ
ncbi:MAG: hypothetical protein JST94_05930 [Bacteroidetes bacterium]|nr:hypothetical protein [Bacteroidota bacterium]MBS1670976.1 hypothetical protein [Bacteroidota bacterium]